MEGVCTGDGRGKHRLKEKSGEETKIILRNRENPG